MKTIKAEKIYSIASNTIMNEYTGKSDLATEELFEVAIRCLTKSLIVDIICRDIETLASHD